MFSCRVDYSWFILHPLFFVFLPSNRKFCRASWHKDQRRCFSSRVPNKTWPLTSARIVDARQTPCILSPASSDINDYLYIYINIHVCIFIYMHNKRDRESWEEFFDVYIKINKKHLLAIGQWIMRKDLSASFGKTSLWFTTILSFRVSRPCLQLSRLKASSNLIKPETWPVRNHDCFLTKCDRLARHQSDGKLIAYHAFNLLKGFKTSLWISFNFLSLIFYLELLPLSVGSGPCHGGATGWTSKKKAWLRDLRSRGEQLWNCVANCDVLTLPAKFRIFRFHKSVNSAPKQVQVID